jgi:hypothetical protein
MWHSNDAESQMFTVATFDDIMRLGDGLDATGTGAGGVAFLVTFVVVRLVHPFSPLHLRTLFNPFRFALHVLLLLLLS